MMHVLNWILILCCWQATEAKTIISIVMNRIKMAQVGEVLDFILSVNIPVNQTIKIECCHLRENITWAQEVEGDIIPKTKQTVNRIKMNNTNFSGDYKCRYDNQEVYYVVLVRDKGYEEPRDVLENDVIIQMCVSGILLIFSVVGSLYILKSYKQQPPFRDTKSKVMEERSNESDDAVMDEEASSSVYTALQHRPSSIYDIVNPKMTAHAEHKRKEQSGQKNCKAQEDEIFDSVYENL